MGTAASSLTAGGGGGAGGASAVAGGSEAVRQAAVQRVFSSSGSSGTNGDPASASHQSSAGGPPPTVALARVALASLALSMAERRSSPGGVSADRGTAAPGGGDGDASPAVPRGWPRVFADLAGERGLGAWTRAQILPQTSSSKLRNGGDRGEEAGNGDDDDGGGGATTTSSSSGRDPLALHTLRSAALLRRCAVLLRTANHALFARGGSNSSPADGALTDDVPDRSAVAASEDDARATDLLPESAAAGLLPSDDVRRAGPVVDALAAALLCRSVVAVQVAQLDAARRAGGSSEEWAQVASASAQRAGAAYASVETALAEVCVEALVLILRNPVVAILGWYAAAAAAAPASPSPAGAPGDPTAGDGIDAAAQQQQQQQPQPQPPPPCSVELVYALQCECLDLVSMLIDRGMRNSWRAVPPVAPGSVSAGPVDDAVAQLARGTRGYEQESHGGEEGVRTAVVAALLRTFAARLPVSPNLTADAAWDAALRAPTRETAASALLGGDSSNAELIVDDAKEAVKVAQDAVILGSGFAQTTIRVLMRCGGSYLSDPSNTAGPAGAGATLSQAKVSHPWRAHHTRAPLSDKALGAVLLLLSEERRSAGDVAGTAGAGGQPWRLALRRVEDPEYPPVSGPGEGGYDATIRPPTFGGAYFAASARALADAIANNDEQFMIAGGVPVVFDSNMVLLLYFLMRDFSPFLVHTTARSDTHRALVLPLCRLSYRLTALPESAGQLDRDVPHFDDLYLAVVCLLLLTEDTTVAANQFAGYLDDPRDVAFFDERPQLAQALKHAQGRAADARETQGGLSVGSIAIMCLARVVQLNLGRIGDQYRDVTQNASASSAGRARRARGVAHVHHAALAAMSNLAPWSSDLHSYAAFRLVKLFEHIGRRHARCHGELTKLAPGEDNTHQLRGLAAYEDLLHLLFKLVNSTLSQALGANPQLVYALLYHQDALQKWFGAVADEDPEADGGGHDSVAIAIDDPTTEVASTPLHQRYSELAFNLFRVVEFFNRRVVEASAGSYTSPDGGTTRAGSESVAAIATESHVDVYRVVAEVLEDAGGLHGLELIPFGQLRFRYQEESHPQDFFRPYARRVVSQTIFAASLYQIQREVTSAARSTV